MASQGGDVVEELSKHDEPLKQVHAQNVAMLFVDRAAGGDEFPASRVRPASRLTCSEAGGLLAPGPGSETG
jgi:hypothetical protein